MLFDDDDLEALLFLLLDDDLEADSFFLLLEEDFDVEVFFFEEDLELDALDLLLDDDLDVLLFFLFLEADFDAVDFLDDLFVLYDFLSERFRRVSFFASDFLLLSEPIFFLVVEVVVFCDDSLGSDSLLFTVEGVLSSARTFL